MSQLVLYELTYFIFRRTVVAGTWNKVTRIATNWLIELTGLVWLLELSNCLPAWHWTGLDRCSLLTSQLLSLTSRLSPLNFGGKFRKLSPAARPQTSDLTIYGSVGSASSVVPVVISHSPVPHHTLLRSAPAQTFTRIFTLPGQQPARPHVRIWRENAECWDIDSWQSGGGGWQVSTAGKCNYMILWSADDDDDYNLTV